MILETRILQGHKLLQFMPLLNVFEGMGKIDVGEKKGSSYRGDF